MKTNDVTNLDGSILARKLSEWLLNEDHAANDSQRLINVLAIGKICLLIEPEKNKKLISFIKEQLEGQSVINYGSSELLVSLLAASMVLSFGSSNQLYEANAYIEIIQELANDPDVQVNNSILSAVFDIEQPGTDNECIEIPLLSRDIPQMMKNTIEQVENFTLFGRKKIVANWVQQSKIDAIGIYAQGLYDLPLAMRCLRASNYLGTLSSITLQTGLNFIKHQQHYDGSFGSYETSIAKISDPVERKELLVGLKLNVSFQMIWTVLELGGQNIITDLRNTFQQENLLNHKNTVEC